MSLVESWPSTEMRSNERFTHTPSSRSAVSGASAASVCTKHSIVAKAGEIIPAPLACALMRTVPLGSVDVDRRGLGEHVGGADRLAERVAAVGRQLAAGREDPLGDRLVRERHADHAGRGDGDDLRVQPGRHRGGALHAGGVVDAAPAGGGVGVAGVGDDRAQRVEPAALLAQDHRRGEHARAREARGADGADGVGDEQPEVQPAARLEPAGHAGGAEARGQPARRVDRVVGQRRPSGEPAPRHCQPLRSRRARTSG